MPYGFSEEFQRQIDRFRKRLYARKSLVVLSENERGLVLYLITAYKKLMKERRKT